MISGWRGRSLFLGIADLVMVLVISAVEADVVVSLIVNVVDVADFLICC